MPALSNASAMMSYLATDSKQQGQVTLNQALLELIQVFVTVLESLKQTNTHVLWVRAMAFWMSDPYVLFADRLGNRLRKPRGKAIARVKMPRIPFSS